MKPILTFALVAAVIGYGLGAVLAYVEVPKILEQQSRLTYADTPPEAQAPKAFARAELPETVFEFGKIERGTSMSHAFKVRNIGEMPLTISVESTTCKCTVGDLGKSEVAPGEETEVTLEWIAKTAPGEFRHGAVLGTNDPTQTSINLTVEGKVVESTAMSPSELIYGSVREGESPRASFYLMQFLDEEIKVLDYELSDPAVAKQMKITIEPADKDELPSADASSGLKITAEYDATDTVGPFRSWLTLTTNLENAQTLTVPIVGNVVGDVSIFGPGWNATRGVLRMGSFESKTGKQVKLKVAIRGEHGKNAQLEVAEIDPPQLQATLGESKQMSEQLTHVPLTVAVPAGTAPLVRLGEPVSSDALIVLRSQHDGVPDVRLRVHFAVE